MRQSLGPKTIQRLRAQTGLPIVSGMVRGNTEHRLDLRLEDGSTVNLWHYHRLRVGEAMRYQARDKNDNLLVTTDDFKVAWNTAGASTVNLAVPK